MKLFVESPSIMSVEGIMPHPISTGAFYLDAPESKTFLLVPFNDHVICLECSCVDKMNQYFSAHPDFLKQISDAPRPAYSDVVFRPQLFMVPSDIIGHIACENIPDSHYYHYSSRIVDAVIEDLGSVAAICIFPSVITRPKILTLPLGKGRRDSLRYYLKYRHPYIENPTLGHGNCANKEICDSFAKAIRTANVKREIKRELFTQKGLGHQAEHSIAALGSNINLQ